MNQMFKKASSVFTAIVCAASITFSGASLVLADGEIDEQTKTTIETTAEGQPFGSCFDRCLCLLINFTVCQNQ